MTVVTYAYRENTLGKKMKVAGGVQASKALAQAEANVETLHDECIGEIDRLLAALNAAVAETAKGDDAQARRTVYEEAKALAGIAGSGGLGGVGEVAYSLCELSDRYIHGGRWNQAAIAVHLGAMQVLRDPAASADEEARRSVLDGLAELVKRAERQE